MLLLLCTLIAVNIYVCLIVDNTIGYSVTIAFSLLSSPLLSVPLILLSRIGSLHLLHCNDNDSV